MFLVRLVRRPSDTVPGHAGDRLERSRTVRSAAGPRRHAVTLPLALALGVLAVPLAAGGQPPGKVPRVGILRAGILPAGDLFMEPFRQGLRDLGYVEGQNILLEFRSAEGKPERFPALAADLVRSKVDIIVASGTAGIRAARKASTTIPIIMAVHGNPVEVGFVNSLARPGGNITGLSFMNPELSAKRVELLKELVPKLRRVVALWDPTTLRLNADVTSRAAQSLGLELEVIEARGRADFASAFAAARRQRAGAVIPLASPVFVSERRVLVDLAARHRLPAVYETREFVDEGGLVSYGAHYPDLFRRAAVYVDKILKGAKPADLPVEQPMRFELVINLKTAKTLGVTFPQSIFIRTDQVIQ